jgi:hypothetical protein
MIKGRYLSVPFYGGLGRGKEEEEEESGSPYNIIEYK